MSEARTRNLAQSQSNIFNTAPAARTRSREIPQSESYIFKPQPPQPKPMTYAREKYNRATITLGQDYDSQFVSDSQAHDYSTLSPAGRKTGHEKSTTYLLGNDRPSFYKKSVNENFGLPSQFEPRYSEETAFERKQREFNNGHSPKKERLEVSEAETGPVSAKERKLNERVSVFDSVSYRPLAQAREVYKPPLYNPNTRKSENLSSNVFNEREVQEYRRPEKLEENEEERRKNHLYSDIFGRPTSPPKPRANNQAVRKNEDYDPRDHAYKQLTSQINFSPENKKNNTRARTPNVQEKPRFRETISSSQMKQEELSTGFTAKEVSAPVVVDLDLADIPKSLNSADIKDLCGGIHLVSLALDIDNFTGQCKGTGKLRIRMNSGSEVKRLERIFGAKGIKVEEKHENLGRKNNFSDIAGVNWHNSYDYRRTTTPLGARENKMKNLESSVFGNGAKWVDRPVESINDELSAQILWKNTKNPRVFY